MDISKVEISLNQFAEFTKSTDAKKTRIIKQQLEVNPFLIPWYQLAKHRIRKFFHDTNEIQPLIDAIEILKVRVPSTSRQATDKKVSLEALERMIKFKIPSYLKGIEYEIVKPKAKAVRIGNVSINVTPDLVIRAKLNGKIVYGGIKMHISKGNPFDLTQCYYVASILHKFLKEKVAKESEIVSPELCFCLDVFGDKLVSSPLEYSTQFVEIEKMCKEVTEVWNMVNVDGDL